MLVYMEKGTMQIRLLKVFDGKFILNNVEGPNEITRVLI